MSEAQKYQGALYKEKNSNKKNNKANNIQPQNVPLPEPEAMAQPAYVEDVPEDVPEDAFEDAFETHAYQGGGSEDGNSPADLLPEAPTPPSAAANDGFVNVFDFLDPSATPNASTLQVGQRPTNEETQLIPYDANAYMDESGEMVAEDTQALVHYIPGAIPLDSCVTPAPKHERRRKDGSEKKDKKRKRLHVDTDQTMIDAPPTLAHSGLTGGINRMMRPVFPPSPDFSGGDADPSPLSPLKKTKHSKHKKSEGGIGNNLLALMNINPTTTSGKTKTKKRKTSSSTKKHTSHRHRDGEKATKLIEYRPGSSDGKKGGNDGNQMVVYRPHADLFLSLVNKGPESERGCSVNKALKRFHRERSSSSGGLSKLMDEKELWRSLRMRHNDRGEIVLFTA